jgi:hypothetical protein
VLVQDDVGVCAAPRQRFVAVSRSAQHMHSTTT